MEKHQCFISVILSTLLTACAATPASGTATGDQALHGGNYTPITLSAGNNNSLSTTDCTTNANICELVGNSGGSTLTGLDASNFNYTDMVWLRNDGAYPITITHADSSSAAGNRFLLRGGTAQVLAPGRSLRFSLRYDYDNAVLIGWEDSSENAIYGVESTATPSRTLGTAFRASAVRPVLGTYAASASCAVTLAGGQAGYVEILSDSANPPTTSRGRIAGCTLTGTVVVGVSLTSTVDGALSYLVPTGDYVLIRAVSTTGSPTLTLAASTEQTL